MRRDRPPRVRVPLVLRAAEASGLACNDKKVPAVLQKERRTQAFFSRDSQRTPVLDTRCKSSCKSRIALASPRSACPSLPGRIKRRKAVCRGARNTLDALPPRLKHKQSAFKGRGCGPPCSVLQHGDAGLQCPQRRARGCAPRVSGCRGRVLGRRRRVEGHRAGSPSRTA